MTGAYVLDADHGWMEIHPVTRITITGHAPAPQPSTAAPAPPPTTAPAPPPSTGGGCYPKTSGGNCYEPGEFCSSAEHGTHGVAGDGKAITCEDDNGYWRWLDG